MKLYLKNGEDTPAVQILENADPTPTGYTEFSQDLLAWRDYGLLACSDYDHFRTRVIEQLDIKEWANLSSPEKDFIIDIHVKESIVSHATDESNKNAFIISSGQAVDAAAADIILSDKWSSYFVLYLEACHKRYKSTELYKIICTYLSFDDRHEFFEASATYFMKFAQAGVKGSSDCSVDGIFDWVESTSGESASGLASNGWTMKIGVVGDFETAIMELIRDGNY